MPQGWAIPALDLRVRAQGRGTAPCERSSGTTPWTSSRLVALIAHLGRTMAETLPADPDDCVALARWDESEGRLADAGRLYAAALDGGADGEGRAHRPATAGPPLPAPGTMGGLPRGSGVRRLRAVGHRQRRLEALIELAKLEEHRRRDYAAAEAVTRRALALVELLALRGGGRTIPSLRREAMEHRLWRLRRRLAASQTRPLCR